MQFKPVSDDELNAPFNIPEGYYECSIKDIYDTDKTGAPLLTKNGAPKWNVYLRVYAPDGEKLLKVNINPAFAKLHKHFCVAFGFLEQYMQGQINIDDFRATGKRAIVVVGEDKWTNALGETISKPSAMDFLVADDKSAVVAKSVDQKTDDFFNDTLPFFGDK